MQIEHVIIREFRNLRNFEISLDKSEKKTVIIGQNASGKSNFLEAIVLIFKYLDLNFSKEALDHELTQGFQIKYNCYGNNIDISYEREKKKKLQILVNAEQKTQKDFIAEKGRYLPRYILAYYSGLGNSNRLEKHFEAHKEKFARSVIGTNQLDLINFPRLQYAELIHSQLSLFSFFIDEDPKLKEFLKKNLFIDDIHSTLLTIKEPDWGVIKKKENPKFWGSTGVVKALLDYLYDHVAIAPFREVVNKKSDLWKKERKSFEVVYLYFSDFSKIRKFVKEKNWNSFDFFHVLNTANVSRLFFQEGIKIQVKKEFAEKVSFKDLSEGEQQLLTVLGLMRFTAGEETLFLLDEPDTHLNPYWRWKYLSFIDEIVSDTYRETTQVIMTSHDPLTIGSLKCEAVRIFDSDLTTGQITTSIPNEDPKGMGVAGILTEIFKLKTTLDKETQNQLERRRHLESKSYRHRYYNDDSLTAEEEAELAKLNSVLDDLGFSRFTRDPLYQKFQAAFDKAIENREKNDRPLTQEEEKDLNDSIYKIVEDILKEEGI